MHQHALNSQPLVVQPYMCLNGVFPVIPPSYLTVRVIPSQRLFQVCSWNIADDIPCLSVPSNKTSGLSQSLFHSSYHHLTIQSFFLYHSSWLSLCHFPNISTVFFPEAHTSQYELALLDWIRHKITFQKVSVQKSNYNKRQTRLPGEPKCIEHSSIWCQFSSN